MGAEKGPHELHPGPERGRALALDAAPPQHAGASSLRLGRELLGQPRLADAGLPGQQQQPPSPRGGVRKATVERLHLGPSADEVALAAAALGAVQTPGDSL